MIDLMKKINNLNYMIVDLVVLLMIIIQYPNTWLGQTSKAMFLYNSDNFSGAISLLSKELINEPHNIRVLLDLGLSSESIVNHSMASVYFNKVIELSDSNPHYAITFSSMLIVNGCKL